VYACVCFMPCMLNIYVYIYIYRERERERDCGFEKNGSEGGGELSG